MAATMGDLARLGVHRAYDRGMRDVFSFVRRNRAFLFSSRTVRGRAASYGRRPFKAECDDPVPERIYLIDSGLMNKAAELAEWLWSKSPDTRTPSLVCVECGKSAEDGDSCVAVLLPSVLRPRPDDQPDAFPWVGQVHIGCQRESRLARLAQRESCDELGVLFAQKWKLDKGVCYKCRTAVVTPATLGDFHFDHVDPLRKAFDVGYLCSVATTGEQLSALAAEADKCELICRSCHIDHTAAQRRKKVIFADIGAQRAANDVPITDPDSAAQVLADLREADVALDTDRLYTRLFCANQETNCFGLSRRLYYQRVPTLHDPDCLRASLEAKWDEERRKKSLLHDAPDTEEPAAKRPHPEPASVCAQ
jgi:hypothetical protein